MQKIKVKIFVESHQINRPKLRLHCIEPYIEPPFSYSDKETGVRSTSELSTPPKKKQKL